MNVANTVSKPSLMTTLTNADHMGTGKDDYKNDDIDLDELKAFLDDGYKPGKGGKRASSKNN